MHAPSLTSNRRAGFTLIELIAVITLVGILAMMALTVYDNVGANAQDQLVRAEMQEVKKALQQFKRDVGHYPKMRHPADFSALILGCEYDEDADDCLELPHWNAEYARGWRGPYLSSDGNGYVAIGDDLQLDGSSKGDGGKRGSPAAGTLTDLSPGVADPFALAPVQSDSNVYLQWRPCANVDGCKGYPTWGRPYYVFELDKPTRARIVSSGPNGVYETQLLPADEIGPPEHRYQCSDIFDEDPDAPERNNGDDVILCLQ